MNWNVGSALLCAGCLSADRPLVVAAGDALSVYLSLLDADCTCQTVQLCWECHAVIRRFMGFKQQVRSAYNTLGSLVTSRTTSSLSKLSISECKNTFFVNEERLSTVPQLTFIKIEDESPAAAEDDYFSETICADDNVITEQTITDRLGVQSDVEPRRKAKGSRRKYKTKQTFNESDEEPLRGGAGAGGARRERPAGVVRGAGVLRELRRLNADGDGLEMVLLSWEEVEAERRRALAGDAFTRHRHRCYHCAVGFNHRCKLERHMLKHDPGAGAAECSQCHVRCRDARALAAHRRRHRVRWRCTACGGTWSRAAVAADHAARAHGAPAPTHACSLCAHTAPTLGKLRSHMKGHGARRRCELCGKTFRDGTSLRTHLFIHRGEKEYACPQCGKRFLFKKAMQVHQLTHAASAQLYCHACDVTFKNRMSYGQHMKYSLKHVDPALLKYACRLCDKRFVKAARLHEHDLAVHLKLTPIACAAPGCSFACSSRAVLRAHVRSVHRAARPRRDHVCDVCGRTYTSKKSLEGHLRAHRGERPFRCGACPAAFGYEAALYNHRRLLHGRREAGRGRAATAAPTLEVPAVGRSDLAPAAGRSDNVSAAGRSDDVSTTRT